MNVLDVSGVSCYCGDCCNISKQHDRWFAVKFNYGDETLCDDVLTFLQEFLEDKNYKDVKIQNAISIGCYNIICNQNNKIKSSRFKVGTLTASYLFCNIFLNDIDKCFQFMPYKISTSLITKKNIIQNGEFEWAAGQNNITDYRKLLQI